MNRGSMRTMLRRRLQEVTADQWADADLNEILDLALSEVQGHVLAVDVEGFLSRSQSNIVAGQTLYPKPDDLRYEVALKSLDTSSGLYKRIQRRSLRDIQDRLESGTSLSDTGGYEYAHFGAFFLLAPAPSASLAVGLEIDYVPNLSMALDSDAPALPTQLHYAVVLRAHSMALGETGEEIGQPLAEYQKLIQEIPSWYLRDQAAEPNYLSAALGKEY